MGVFPHPPFARSLVLLTPIPTTERPPGPAPVRQLSEAEERSLVAGVEAHPFATILCLSDLHLGVGADPQTGRYAPRENFLADGPFARCLAAVGKLSGGPARVEACVGSCP